MREFDLPLGEFDLPLGEFDLPLGAISYSGERYQNCVTHIHPTGWRMGIWDAKGGAHIP